MEVNVDRIIFLNRCYALCEIHCLLKARSFENRQEQLWVKTGQWAFRPYSGTTACGSITPSGSRNAEVLWTPIDFHHARSDDKGVPTINMTRRSIIRRRLSVLSVCCLAYLCDKRKTFPCHLTVILVQVQNAECLGCSVDETSFDEMNPVRDLPIIRISCSCSTLMWQVSFIHTCARVIGFTGSVCHFRYLFCRSVARHNIQGHEVMICPKRYLRDV